MSEEMTRSDAAEQVDDSRPSKIPGLTEGDLMRLAAGDRKSKEEALAAIRTVAILAYGLAETYGPETGDLPDEARRLLPEFTEMVKKAGCAVSDCKSMDGDTYTVLTLAALALEALQHSDATGLSKAARGGLVIVAYSVWDRYQDLLQELSPGKASAEVAQA